MVTSPQDHYYKAPVFVRPVSYKDRWTPARWWRSMNTSSKLARWLRHPW